jgi:ankyrin repeat protein
MYGWGAVLALVMVLGVLVLPVLWFEVLGHQTARRLLLAVDRGDRQATRFWLLIVDQNNMAYPPLVLATRQGNREMVHLLLEEGADVNLRAKMGSSPLEVAARRGDLVLMRDLLDLGGLPQGEEDRRRWWTNARIMAEEEGCDALLPLVPPESPAPSP